MVCLKEPNSNEVFLPFSFIRKYFEVYGKLSSDGSGSQSFHWQHSYSKYSLPTSKYRANGPYLWFGNYNVAVRDRVKCISGVEGVPVSTQWDSNGHLYPTQIAQFGLSHFSKNLSLSSPLKKHLLFTEGSSHEGCSWTTESKLLARYSRMLDEDTLLPVMQFKTAGSEDDLGVELNFKATVDYPIIQLDLFLGQNGSVSALVMASGTLYGVHYIMTDTLITSKNQDVYIGIGAARNSWRTLTRDVFVDLRKGLAIQTGTGKRASKTAAALLGKSMRITKLVFRGYGRVGNATLLTAAHDEYFYAACNYLVKNQDANGGWPIAVGRTLVPPDILTLKPPWYSAMAQGQAMSLLVRAYLVTRQPPYLNTALKALALFKKSSSEGGIRTRFADKFSWYEEYPTAKSSFVLNGFIYSLFGIYDVFKVSNDSDAKALFLDGILSLKHMLPLFDTGSGTVYDLRHFSIPSLPPNIARWDYHTTHISQLLYLNTIMPSKVFEITAQRWIDYLRGKRAPHN